MAALSVEESGDWRVACAERRVEAAESAGRAAAAAAAAAAHEARAAQQEVERLRAEGLELSRWREAVLGLRDELKIARRGGWEGEEGSGAGGEGPRRTDDGRVMSSPRNGGNCRGLTLPCSLFDWKLWVIGLAVTYFHRLLISSWGSRYFLFLFFTGGFLVVQLRWVKTSLLRTRPKPSTVPSSQRYIPA